jgi:hypothetical protein
MGAGIVSHQLQCTMLALEVVEFLLTRENAILL